MEERRAKGKVIAGQARHKKSHHAGSAFPRGASVVGQRNEPSYINTEKGNETLFYQLVPNLMTVYPNPIPRTSVARRVLASFLRRSWHHS